MLESGFTSDLQHAKRRRKSSKLCQSSEIRKKKCKNSKLWQLIDSNWLKMLEYCPRVLLYDSLLCCFLEASYQAVAFVKVAISTKYCCWGHVENNNKTGRFCAFVAVHFGSSTQITMGKWSNYLIKINNALNFFFFDIIATISCSAEQKTFD